jgi:hypothetical protein
MKPKKKDRSFKRGTRKEKWYLRLPINQNEDMCPVIKCRGFMDFRKKFKYYSDKYDLETIWVKTPFERGNQIID